MEFLKFLKKIGAVIVWPFKHEQMIEHVYETVKTDLPETLVVVKTLAQKLAAIGPDALAVIASKGFDVPEDVKTAVDLKDVFTYVKDTVLPTVEKDFTDLVAAAESKYAAPANPSVLDPAPAAPVVTAATQTTRPGLHNQIPA